MEKRQSIFPVRFLWAHAYFSQRIVCHTHMPSHTSRRLSEMLPYADLVLFIEFHFLFDSKDTTLIL